MKPEKISILEKQYLHIAWNDESETKIKLSTLRKKCPCAICTSEREEQGEKYIPLYTLDQLTVVNISIVGSYAVSIGWKDGHNTGIYEFELLHKMAETN